MSHANAHQKVTSTEEELSNQVDRKTHSVDSQLLSPASPAVARWAREPWALVGEMGVKHGWARQHGLPLTEADWALAAAECQI